MSFSLLGRGGKFPLMNGLRPGRLDCIFPLNRECVGATGNMEKKKTKKVKKDETIVTVSFERRYHETRCRWTK
jgi:hypothetical protein